MVPTSEWCALQDSSTLGPERSEGRLELETAGRAHSDNVGMVRPAGLEPATSWFVAVNTFVDPAQLTSRKDSQTARHLDPILDPSKLPSGWVICRVEYAHGASGERLLDRTHYNEELSRMLQQRYE